MRTYGRVRLNNGTVQWQQVSTDNNGSNDYVYATTLCQCLLLNLNESPFFANYGIPAHTSVVQQIFPDYYVARTQKQFASFFASLLISKQPSRTPTYNVNITTHQGVQMAASVPK